MTVTTTITIATANSYTPTQTGTNCTDAKCFLSRFYLFCFSFFVPKFFLFNSFQSIAILIVRLVAAIPNV